MKFKNTIGFKLLMAFLVLSLVPAAVLSLSDYYYAKAKFTENTYMALRDMVTCTADNTDKWVKAQLTQLEKNAADRVLIDGDETKISAFFKQIKDQNPEIETIGYAGLDGLFSDATHVVVDDYDFFHKAITGQTVVSNMLVSKINSKKIIVMATPIRNQGKITGVFICTFDAKDLTAITENTKFGQSGYAYMVDTVGMVIAHPDQNLILKEDITKINSFSESMLAEKMLRGETGQSEFVRDGVNRLVVYTPVKSTGWVIAITIPVNEVYAHVSALRLFGLIGAIIAIIVVIVLSLMLAKQISWPIITLAGKADELATGNLQVDIPVNYSGELGVLGQSLATMVSNLEKLDRQEKEEQWLKSKIAEIHTLFYGVKDIQEFSRLLMDWICKIVDASCGVFYFNWQMELTKRASYAGDGQEVGVKKIRVGEGLVGQCLLENRVIELTNIPDNYIQVNSGLGKTPPRYLIILPIEFEGKVVSVIELASLSEFSPLEREFLERVRANIGIVQKHIVHGLRVQKLLEESQTLTEELQVQAEELQMQQEELKTIDEENVKLYKNSEQKNVELQEAKAKLEEQTHSLALSSQYKSEFLSNMSHELRTPLNSLLILSKMLADNRDGNLSLKQVEYAETILSSGNDLLKLINDILDLSRIEAGKVQINPEPIYLEKLKDALEKQFSPLARHKGLNLTVQIESDLQDAFYTDEYRLRQILKNLLSNAVKFTHQGYVQLKIRSVSKTFSPKLTKMLEFHDLILAFSVTDTGIGITSDKQDLIFEAFLQADGTTNRQYGGTGLGLSISRELADLLGGFIELDSTEGKGSTFTLYLPSYSSKIAAQEPLKREVTRAVAGELVGEVAEEVAEEVAAGVEGSAVWDLTNVKILVVDDDMRNVFAITAALEELQIEVLFAENGQEALASLQMNSDIDLVLMDIMMPEMDGYEAMKLIRQMPEYVDLPIIALTAKAMKGDREKCLQAGASDYISKPLEIDQLISIIKVWLYR